MGRKPIAAELSRRNRIAVMLTDEEYEQFDAARERMGYPTMSDMIREEMAPLIAKAKRK